MAHELSLTFRLEDPEDGESAKALRKTAENRVRAAQLVALSYAPGEAVPLLMDIEQLLEAANAMDAGKKVKLGFCGRPSEASLSDIRRHARILRLAICASDELAGDKRPLEELALSLELSLDPLADEEEKKAREWDMASLKRQRSKSAAQ